MPRRSMRRMLGSFRGRFTLWAIGSFVALPLLAAIASELVFRAVYTPRMDRALHDDAQTLAAALEPCRAASLDRQALEACLDHRLRTRFPRRVVFAQIVALPGTPDETPRVLARSYSMQDLEFPLSPRALATLRAGEPVFQTVGRYNFDHTGRVVAIALRNGPSSILQLSLDMDEAEDFGLEKRPHLFFLMLPFLLCGAAVWGYFFVRGVFAPVHDIVSIAQRISAEDLSHRIEGIESDDEIGELAATLNAMIARLERSFRQMEQFSSDVAHELRTPLTIIAGEVEVALKRDRTPQEYRAVLSSLIEEARRLGTMVEDLLLLARIEGQSAPPRFGAVDLDAVILEACDEAATLGRKKGVAVAVLPLEPTIIPGEAGLVRRLLANLLRNAVAYTDAGGRVSVGLVGAGSEATVSITDTGCGIPAKALPFIFDRFYRVDPSRSHETGGTGLGLALVEKIASLHKGRVDVSSEVGKGTVFRVTFPRG
jgi:heavy metal sensor kinase